MIFNIENTFAILRNEIVNNIEAFWPKVIWALIIVLIWYLCARLLYIFSMFVFKKFKLNEIIDRFKVNMDQETLQCETTQEKKQQDNKKNLKIIKNRFTDKIKVDDSISKWFAIFIFIIFFRLAISYIGITEIEIFLKDLIDYLPNLFVGILIWFFGIRFANFIYDVIYHTLSVTKEKTSKIIAYSGKIIILFFTLMLFLDYTKIVNEFIINTIVIWFVAMMTLAGGLAFGLGGKDIAQEILESFRK